MDESCDEETRQFTRDEYELVQEFKHPGYKTTVENLLDQIAEHREEFQSQRKLGMGTSRLQKVTKVSMGARAQIGTRFPGPGPDSLPGPHQGPVFVNVGPVWAQG